MPTPPDTVTLTCGAVLCDMDGTLVDSTAVVEAVWAEFARDYGIDLDVLLEHAHGRPTVQTVQHFAPAGADVPGITARHEAQEQSRTEGVVEIPGAADFVAQVPADAIAIVTSATADLLRVRMQVAGVALPDTLVTADDLLVGKPDPGPYLRAAELLGVAPADAVVFEDSEAGVRAGLAAGMRTVLVGPLATPITEGLPRVRDFRDVEVDVVGDDASDRLRLTLHVREA